MNLPLSPQIKAVAFDLDGTLVDFVEMKKRTARQKIGIKTNISP